MSQQPLPPGWEAKYDPGHQRYFFINHQTKQTTWTDPRLDPANYYPQSQQYQQQSYYQQAASWGYQGQTQQQTTDHSMSAMSTQAREPTPSSAYQPQQQQRQQESSFTEEASDDEQLVSDEEKRKILRRLRQEFDLEGVSDAILNDAMEAANYNEDLCVQMFGGMGFSKKGAKQETSSSSTARWQTGTSNEPSSSSSSSTARWQTGTSTPPRKAASPAPAASPARAESNLSAASKKSKKTKKAISFVVPSSTDELQPSTIAALPTISAPSTTVAPSTITAPEPSYFTTSATSLENELDQAMANMEDALKGLNTMTSTKSTAFTSSASTTMDSMLSRAKKDTKQIFKQSQNTSALLAAKTTESVRIAAVGQNTELANGPDPGLLSGSIVRAQGPDSSLCTGARLGLASGPNPANIGARAIACGADSALSNGRNVMLNVGPRMVGTAV